jgi:putative phage-type endonuclease
MNAAERKEWLAERRTGIGGSDVAGILGLSRWTTPYQVYLDKIGEAPPTEDNAPMRWGRYLEPVIRQAYSDETGREVRLMPMVRHPLHEFMFANLDGFTDGGRLVEIKTARTAEGWGEPGTDQIPTPYLFQVQHYLEVTGFEVADVPVLIGGSDFRIYEVWADAELAKSMVEAEAEFWARVQRRDPPPVVTMADAIARWGRSSRAESVEASPDARASIETLRTIKAQRSALDELEEAARAVVMRELGDRDTLVGPDGAPLVTWKAQAGAKRIDVKALQELRPTVYQEFLRAGEPTRRFLLK